MFRTLTIKTKLAGVLLALALFCLIQGIGGVLSLAEANRAVSNLYQQRMQALGRLDRMEVGLLSLAVQIRHVDPIDPARRALVDELTRGVDAAWTDYQSAPLADAAGARRFQAAWSAAADAVAARRDDGPDLLVRAAESARELKGVEFGAARDV